MSVEKFKAGPASESCRLIPFESAEILESFPPKLVVRGTAPCLNMEVSLQPMVYIQCPEYWRIEVVGCLPGGICLTTVKPYTVSISLEGIIGSQGIEVAGSNQQKKIDVSGGCDGRRSFDYAAK